jgi:hypothetical protein
MSFTGRPPLLSETFFKTPLPLDLKDEYLFGDRETLLARAADTLDANGWNIEGGLYSSTYIRGRTILASIKGRVAEIALANDSEVSVEVLL